MEGSRAWNSKPSTARCSSAKYERGALSVQSCFSLMALLMLSDSGGEQSA